MDIHKLTEDVLKQLMIFKLDFDVSEYLSRRAASNWRDFEAEQHVNDYPIKGCGLIANPSKLQSWSFQKETILNLEEDLAPEETGSAINGFPKSTVSIMYIYSLLEGYGNSVCDELNPHYRAPRQAWHHKVYGDADISKSGVMNKMIDGFCKPFGFAVQQVPENIVSALIALKKQRNLIVHELQQANDFELYFRCVVSILCCIYFCCPNAKAELKIYPW